MPIAFSSVKAKKRSTHIFLSGSGPNSYSRVIFSPVVVDEFDFLDFVSGFGVPLPSTLLFILLFISGLGAIPLELLAMFGPME